jgi:hypothetical protein
MTDRPIIFSAPMVRALLDGRKTQTRRVLKPWPGAQADWLTMDVLHQAPSCYLAEVDGRLGVQMQHPHAGQRINRVDIAPMSPLTWVRLPYAPGDRLWVREAFRGDKGYDAYPPREWSRWPVHYEADGNRDTREGMGADGRLRHSIHMPRWASRITLTVTDVRVQRLQDISEADAVAEGVDAVTMDDVPRQAAMSRRSDFAALWNSLHGPDAWDRNSWVVALTFTVQRGNIDALRRNTEG